MSDNYVLETLARQRMDETARQARTAHQRLRLKTGAGWHFPQVTFPGRPQVATVRPA